MPATTSGLDSASHQLKVDARFVMRRKSAIASESRPLFVRLCATKVIVIWCSCSPYSFAFKCHRVNSSINAVNGIAFHPQQKNVFATCGADGSYVFWDKGRKKLLHNSKLLCVGAGVWCPRCGHACSHDPRVCGQQTSTHCVQVELRWNLVCVCLQLRLEHGAWLLRSTTCWLPASVTLLWLFRRAPIITSQRKRTTTSTST